MRAREIEDREAKTMQILKDEKSARKKVLRVSSCRMASIFFAMRMISWSCSNKVWHNRWPGPEMHIK